jgi:hypothetical protein
MRHMSIWLFASFVLVNVISGYVNGGVIATRSIAATLQDRHVNATTGWHAGVVQHGDATVR